MRRMFKFNAILCKPVDEDFEQCIKSIDKFLNTVDYVFEIRVLGGEPFMYKRILVRL